MPGNGNANEDGFLDILHDIITLNFGFKWYSSGGTDPNAKDENSNVKHVIPIDQKDVDDVTLAIDKSVGKDKMAPITPGQRNDEFNKRATNQRNSPGSKEDKEMPRDTPDDDPFKNTQKQTGTGSKTQGTQPKQKGYSYEGNPQGDNFAIINHDTGQRTVIRKNGKDVGVGE